MSYQPLHDEKKSQPQDYQAVNHGRDVPPPYIANPGGAAHHHQQQPVIHDDIYQPVGDDPIQQQPIPNRIVAPKEPEFEVRNNNTDVYLFAAICMTACGLFMSSFMLFLCALPIGFCIYQASQLSNNTQKQGYMKAALISSIIYVISSIVLFILLIILFGVVAYYNAKEQVQTQQ